MCEINLNFGFYMKKIDFLMGTEFICGEKKWRTTDIGTRVIVAICIEDNITPNTDGCSDIKIDRADWFYGPIYAVEEVVFDENDIIGCHKV